MKGPTASCSSRAGPANLSRASTPPSPPPTYDPRTGTSTATENMTTNRRNHSATLLPDGRVLVLGGINHGDASRSAELYDTGTGN